MENIKQAKIQGLDIVCKDLDAEILKPQIIEMINSCKTLEEINTFCAAQEILKIKDTLDFKKQQKIIELKNNATTLIYGIYPIWKQVNIVGKIDGYIDDDKIAMNEFISNVINNVNAKEGDITLLNEKEDIDNFNVSIILGEEI